MPKTDFAGFQPELIKFLSDLGRNNNRDWFNANKKRYEQQIVDPVLEFIAAMGPPLRKVSRHFEAIPKKTGGSLMRVYRDTRFSKDKTPYKTNVGIHFRHALGKDVHAPGFYVHFDTKDVFLGIGLWHPEPAALAGIRERIATRQKDWLKARDDKDFRRQFELGGESLKRPPKGYAADHPLIDDLKRKDFIAMNNLAAKDLYRGDFADRVGGAFVAAKPFMRFLCRAVDVPF
ncbi:MAG: DUF2461 domain-containing protein [Gammaproteobacteria bacterium]